MKLKSAFLVPLVVLILINSCFCATVREPKTQWDVSTDYGSCHYVKGGVISQYGLKLAVITKYKCDPAVHDEVVFKFTTYAWFLRNSDYQGSINDAINTKDEHGNFIIADDQRPILKNLFSSITETLWSGHTADFVYEGGVSTVNYDGEQRAHTSSITSDTFNKVVNLLEGAVEFTF